MLTPSLHRQFLALLCHSLLLFGCLSSRSESAPTVPLHPFPEEMQAGFCYAHAWESPDEGGYGSPLDEKTLQRLRDLGTTWVSITPFAFQSKRDSASLRGTTANYAGAESDERLRKTTETAHRLGLKVLLKPHVWVGDNSWCGAIRPPDWDVWMDSYEPVALHYARLAQEIKADGYAIGNELGTATAARPQRFQALIQKIRSVYTGPLTYAANWDEAPRVSFWQDLDAIGINAYWPLSKSRDASEEEIFQAAQQIEQGLATLSAAQGRPILLTEIGYRSVHGTAVDPNTWPENDRERLVDFEAQKQTYRAVFRALWGKPYLRGFYVWKVISDGTWREDGGERGFSPLGKPAEEVIREYYRKGAAGGRPAQ